MTITSTNTRQASAGDDSTTLFSWPHRVYDAGDILVFLKNDTTEVYTLQTVTTHYTISVAADYTSASITMITPPATGETLILVRSSAITQAKDFSADNTVNLTKIEEQLDRMAVQIQDVWHKTKRAFGFSDGSADTIGEVPDPVAHKSLKWNAAATALEHYTPSPVSSAGSTPTTVPTTVGEIYIDTAADAVYVAVDTVSINDWVMLGSTSNNQDHGALVGLVDDDHTQYSIISTGSGAPATTPPREGAIYVDTTGDDVYLAKGVASSADWVKGGDMLASTYDPGSVAGDAFDMDNMVEGTTTKIMTDTERTKLSGIETAADVTDATNVASAGAVMDSDISPAEGFLRKTGAGAYTAIKSNLSGTTAPTANEDSGDGYGVGSLWIDTTNDNVYVCVDPSAAAAVWNQLDAAGGGKVISRNYAQYTTATAMSTIIPVNDTIPQNTEGTEVLTVTITPASTSNRVRVRFSCQGAGSGTGINVSAALFQDSTADAIKAMSVYVANGNGEAPLFLEHEYAPSTTSTITLKIRVGPSSGTYHINRYDSVNRVFGGVSIATLIVEEIEP